MIVQQGPLYYVHNAEVPPPFTGTIQYRDQKGVDQRITAIKFFDLTQAHYVTASRPTYRFIATLPDDVAVDDRLYSHRFPEATDENLRLVHMEGENAFVRFGVVAARVIKCGEAICHYKGQYIAKDQQKSDYQLGDVNAEKFRNLGAMVNHSFPNAKFGGWDHAGFWEWVVVAIDDIKEGEHVCTNYGHGYQNVSLGKHAELRYDAAAQFVKEADIRKDVIGDDLNNVDKWHYLATNPSLVLELYFNGDWSWGKIEKFCTDIRMWIVTLPKVFDAVREWLRIGIGMSDKALQALRELKPDLHKEISEYFRQAGRTRSCLGAVYALRMLPCYLAEIPLTKETWLELQQRLDPYIDAWEQIFNRCFKEGQEFTEDTPLHRALRVICNDPTIEGISF